MDLSRWSSAIIKLGFPIVIAGVLTWFVLFTVNTKLNTIEAAVNAHTLDAQKLNNTIDGLKNSVDANTNATKAEQVRTNIILQQICINGSASRDRVNCLR